MNGGMLGWLGKPREYRNVCNLSTDVLWFWSAKKKKTLSFCRKVFEFAGRKRCFEHLLSKIYKTYWTIECKSMMSLWRYWFWRTVLAQKKTNFEICALVRSLLLLIFIGNNWCAEQSNIMCDSNAFQFQSWINLFSPPFLNFQIVLTCAHYITSKMDEMTEQMCDISIKLKCSLSLSVTENVFCSLTGSVCV